MEATDRLKTHLLVGTADAIWIIYRVVKGWFDLSDNRPMPA